MAPGRAVGFEDLVVQTRMTNALLAVLLQKSEEMTQSELIVTLSSTGAPPSEIAAVLGTTVNTVNVALSRSRKRQRERAKGGGSEG